MTIRVCISGATGWTGSAVAKGILRDDDFELVGAVARSSAGQEVGGVTICSTLAEALQTPTDVVIDYTGAGPVKEHVLYAIEQGVCVVVGSSGMSAADYDDIALKAEDKGVGVIGGGNFSVTATLMQRLALMAARHVPQFEVLDFASAGKEDVPSGTARELAEKLGDVQKPKHARALADLHGPLETRGADINGVQVHSVRLPGYTLRCGATFGLEGERLSIVHEAGQSAEPYVSGTLMAAKKVVEIKGLVRGLDELMFADDG
jgi:4-hydroxy-tetrahydrodipicolinate reductase